MSSSNNSVAVKRVHEMLKGTTQLSLSQQQNLSKTRKVANDGCIWTSQWVIPAPREDDIRQKLFRIVRQLGEGKDPSFWPQSCPIEVEWIGHRISGHTSISEQALSKGDKLETLVKGGSYSPTIIYVHGGAY